MTSIRLITKALCPAKPDTLIVNGSALACVDLKNRTSLSSSILSAPAQAEQKTPANSALSKDKRIFISELAGGMPARGLKVAKSYLQIFS
jgi:hypothetical protein